MSSWCSLPTLKHKLIRLRIRRVDSIEAFGNVDIAIEVLSVSCLCVSSALTSVTQAVSESLPLKEKIFASLAAHLPVDAILASNTSSISLTKIAAACGPARAHNCVGFHFCELKRRVACGHSSPI